MSASLTDLLLSMRLEKYGVARLELLENVDCRFAAPLRACAHFVLDGEVELTVGSEVDSVILRCGDYALLIRGTSHRLSGGVGAIEDGPALGKLGLADEPPFLTAGQGRPIAHLLTASFGIGRKTIIDQQTIMPSLIVIRAADTGLGGLGGQGAGGLARLCMHGGGSAFAVSLLHILFVQALRTILDSRKQLDVSDLGLSPVNAAIRLVVGRLEDPWTVEQIARAVGMSRSAFSAMFTVSTGEPPLHFVNRMRMERATELLVETDLPIVKVALQTGYLSQSAFTRAFKRHHRQPPGEFRMQAKRPAPAGMGLS